jgi:hypothetical protein
MPALHDALDTPREEPVRSAPSRLILNGRNEKAHTQPTWLGLLLLWKAVTKLRIETVR